MLRPGYAERQKPANARTAAHYGQKSASARLSISEGTPISQQGQGYTDSPRLED